MQWTRQKMEDSVSNLRQLANSINLLLILMIGNILGTWLGKWVEDIDKVDEFTVIALGMWVLVLVGINFGDKIRDKLKD